MSERKAVTVIAFVLLDTQKGLREPKDKHLPSSKKYVYLNVVNFFIPSSLLYGQIQDKESLNKMRNITVNSKQFYSNQNFECTKFEIYKPLFNYFTAYSLINAIEKHKLSSCLQGIRHSWGTSSLLFLSLQSISVMASECTHSAYRQGSVSLGICDFDLLEAFVYGGDRMWAWNKRQ